MKEHFLDRLYEEYQSYKTSVLNSSNMEIFDKCYEIDAILNLYKILMEKAEEMSDYELEALLKHEEILMELYYLWLKKDDENYSEMERHVEDTVQNMTRPIQEEEGVIYGGKY